jgi:CubicO group peptidase (beta-lactamase class C family)
VAVSEAGSASLLLLGLLVLHVKSRAAKLTAGLVLAALACGASGASEPSVAASDRIAGFSLERLGRLTERMQEFQRDGRVSGVVTLVFRHGVVAHGDALGYQDLARKTPMQRDTIFRIASMTKPITSVAVLMLVEEGKLGLNDPVDRWLPEFAHPVVLRDPAGPLSRTVPAPRPITVLDLLTHRSGLAYEDTSSGPLSKALTESGLGGSNWTLPPDQWIQRLARLPLAYTPGTRWNYGLSTDVLGVLVARVSGMAFPEFLRTRVFEPLGMKDTGFWVPPERMGRLATLYALDPKTGTVRATDTPPQSALASPPAFSSGGGGLVSTGDDYLRFARMLLGGGQLDGVRLLSPRMVERMATNQLTPEQRRIPFLGLDFWAGQGFGLGVSVVDDPTRTIGSQLLSKGTHGWGGVHGTWYFVDPQEDLAAVMLIQLTGGGQSVPMIPAFETAIYQALVE